MSDPNRRPLKVAIVWRGDATARAEAGPGKSRFKAVFEALKRQGIAAEPAIWAEAFAGEFQAQLMEVSGVLVWVDPIAKPSGEGRDTLDAVLRAIATNGILVSAHPDVIARIGTKEVLYRTRNMGWGTETYLYESHAAFTADFPGRVDERPRVLKQNRGNGGIGVWKVEASTGSEVIVQEARDRQVRAMPLNAFMAERVIDFASGGSLVDQPFQARHLDGMIRCYVSGDRVAGFGHQPVRALAPPEAGPAPPRLYSGPDDGRFQRLRVLMEREWIPQMAELLGLGLNDLPVIWDADFLLGPKTSEDEDTYVLCEINASSVFPIPDEAPDPLAATMRRRLAATAQ